MKQGKGGLVLVVFVIWGLLMIFHSRIGWQWIPSENTITAFFLIFILLYMRDLSRQYSQESARLKREKSVLESRRGEEHEIILVLDDIQIILERLSEEPDVRDVLGLAAQLLKNSLKLDAVVVLLCSGRRISTRIELGQKDIDLGKRLISEVAEDGRTHLISNISSFPEYDSLSRQGFKGLMIAPLDSHVGPIGLIAGLVREGNERRFLSFELKLMKTFSRQAGLIIDNARLSQRMKKELDLATTVQMNLIPKEDPKLPGYNVKGLYRAATEVGGDYYDYAWIGDKHEKLAIIIADVSGHGVPAALLMTMFRTILRNEAEKGNSAAETIKSVNGIIYNDVRKGYFITACYAVLDLTDHTVTIINAGHPQTVCVRHKSDTYELLKPEGIAVGFDGGTLFNRVLQKVTYKLEPGDSMLFFTDGITEAFNMEGEEYRLERLCQSFLRSVGQDAEGMINSMYSDVKEFMGQTEQNDDITMVVLNRDSGG